MNVARNILVATDFSELGQAAVQQAAALAEQLDAKFNIVSVFTRDNAREAAILTGASPGEALDDVKDQLAQLELEYRPRGRLQHVILERGEPAATILQTAAQLRADMIVIATHSRRGLNRVLMGSTAEQVLREARVPVFIVKLALRPSITPTHA